MGAFSGTLHRQTRHTARLVLVVRYEAETIGEGGGGDPLSFLS
jgi:hypothetical protein